MNKFTTYYKQIEVLKCRTSKQAKIKADKLNNKMLCDFKLSSLEYGILCNYMNDIVSMKEAEERCANFI